MKLHHGGRLRAATEHYGIALADWLDLSTAINPHAWPVPTIPDEVWQRLPEDDDRLLQAAAHYYGQAETGHTDIGHDKAHPLLPVPGTQAVIEALPRLFLPRRVWVPAIGYQEHAFCWRKHGHEVLPYSHPPAADRLQAHDVVVVINPNNPTTERHAPGALRILATQVAAHEGLLVVDEAFMDCTPTDSLLTAPLPPATVVMRSFGKFFGLAGIRLGFCFASPKLLQRLEVAIGPWAVNHPARWIAQHALADLSWQQHARTRLQITSAVLCQTLQTTLSTVLQQRIETRATTLFITLSLGARTAEAFYHHCARQGILLRLFAEAGLVRIGITPTDAGNSRLLQAASTFWGQADSQA